MVTGDQSTIALGGRALATIDLTLTSAAITYP
jgi:hypothetical protein